MKRIIKMYREVLVFVSWIVTILGRPAAENNNLNYGSSVKIPPWPLEQNVFLLPAKINSNDLINMTIDITKYAADEIVVSFMGEDYNSNNAVICSIKADKSTRTVTIFNEKDEAVVDEQIDHFFLDDEKLLFNMWIKRRENVETDENNILEVNTKSFALKPFRVDNIDQIRYLKFSGGNAKMVNLDFKFA